MIVVVVVVVVVRGAQEAHHCAWDLGEWAAVPPHHVAAEAALLSVVQLLPRGAPSEGLLAPRAPSCAGPQGVHHHVVISIM